MPIYHKNKEVIYSANEPAVAFYIIYDGNCHLINSQAGVTDNNIDQMSRHTRKIVLTLEKGDIIGLESLSMEKNKVYEFTLISNNDSTTLLKIDLSKLNPENAAQITNELLNIHETKRKIIHDMLETRNKIQNKMQEYVKNARETKKLLTKTYDTNNKSIEEELIKIRFKKLEEKFKFRNLPIRKYRIDQESFKYEKIKSNTRNSEENIDLSKNKMPKMHSRHTSLITTTKSKPFTPLMSPIRNSNLVHSFSRDAKSKVMQTSHISSEVMLSSNLRKTVGEWKLTMEGKRNYQYTTKRFKLPLYIMKSSENC